MKKKGILIAVLIILIIVVVVFYFISKITKSTEVSADVVNTETATQNSILTLDDGLSEVNPGQDITFQVGINFLNWIIEQQNSNLTSEQIHKKITNYFKGKDFYIKAFLASGKKNDKWILSKPNLNIPITAIFKDGKIQEANFTVQVKVPETISLDDNLLISSLALYEKKTTCSRGFITNCITDWKKIAVAVDEDLVNYNESLVDLRIVNFSAVNKFANPHKENILTFSYINGGKNPAANTEMKLYVENTYSIPKIPKGATLNYQVIDNAKYNVLTWKLGTVEAGANKSYKLQIKPLKRPTKILTSKAWLEITTTSQDTDLANNEEEIYLAQASQ